MLPEISLYIYIWLYMRVSINGGTQNRWFAMENPIKMDDLGVPLFWETSICIYIYICIHILFGE